MSILAKKNFLRSYIDYCTHIFLAPKSFFKVQFKNTSLNKSISFGLLSIWLSSIILFIYESLLILIFHKYLPSVSAMKLSLNFNPEKTRAEAFVQEVYALLIDPYTSLITLLIFSLGIFISAKIFVPHSDESKVSFKNCLKLFSVSAIGAWFSIIPIMGAILYYGVALLLLVTGIKEIFHISTARSLVIVFAPQIILLAGIGVLLSLAILFLIAGMLPMLIQFF